MDVGAGAGAGGAAVVLAAADVVLELSLALSGAGCSYFGAGGIKPTGDASRTGAVVLFALGGASVVELACGFSLVFAAAVVIGAGVGSLLGSTLGSFFGSTLGSFFGSFVGSTLGSFLGSAFGSSALFASFAFGLLFSSSFFGAFFGSAFSAGFLVSTLLRALAAGPSSPGPTSPTDDCARTTVAADRQHTNAITAEILLDMTLNFLLLIRHDTDRKSVVEGKRVD